MLMEVHSVVISKSEHSRLVCFFFFFFFNELMLKLVTEKKSHSVRCGVFGFDNDFLIDLRTVGRWLESKFYVLLCFAFAVSVSSVDELLWSLIYSAAGGALMQL